MAPAPTSFPPQTKPTRRCCSSPPCRAIQRLVVSRKAEKIQLQLAVGNGGQTRLHAELCDYVFGSRYGAELSTTGEELSLVETGAGAVVESEWSFDGYGEDADLHSTLAELVEDCR